MLYIVTWTGGYEEPSYCAHATLEAAEAMRKLWQEDAEEFDFVEILEVDPERVTVDRIRISDDE